MNKQDSELPIEQPREENWETKGNRRVQIPRPQVCSHLYITYKQLAALLDLEIQITETSYQLKTPEKLSNHGLQKYYRPTNLLIEVNKENGVITFHNALGFFSLLYDTLVYRTTKQARQSEKLGIEPKQFPSSLVGLIERMFDIADATEYSALTSQNNSYKDFQRFKSFSTFVLKKYGVKPTKVNSLFFTALATLERSGTTVQDGNIVVIQGDDNNQSLNLDNLDLHVVKPPPDEVEEYEEFSDSDNEEEIRPSSI